MNDTFLEYQAEIIRMTDRDPKRCMICGKCTASCPAFYEMDFHPHQIVGMVERCEFDVLETVEGLWHCMSCMACSERCPRDVQPARFMDAVRQWRIRKQGGEHLHPQQVPEKIDEATPQQAIAAAFRKYRK